MCCMSQPAMAYSHLGAQWIACNNRGLSILNNQRHRCIFTPQLQKDSELGSLIWLENHIDYFYSRRSSLLTPNVEQGATRPVFFVMQPREFSLYHFK